MASLREVKTKEELKLLKKAVRISAIGTGRNYESDASWDVRNRSTRCP